MKLLDREFIRKAYPGWSKYLIRSHQMVFKDVSGESFGPVQRLFLGSYFLYKKWWEDPFDRFSRGYPGLFREGHVLDVGACIGYTAQVFRRAADSRYRVYAFEPEPRNQQMLKLLIGRTGSGSGIVPVDAAVGAASGEIELWRNRMHHGDHRVATAALKEHSPEAGDLLRVRQWSLDDFCEDRSIADRIAFVKIDVQGYEIEVLRGMRRIIASNPRIAVAMEYSPEYFDLLGQKKDDLFGIIEELGLQTYRITARGKLAPFNVAESERILTKKNYFDILCVSKGRAL